ncbi:hypothetical protein [Bradyrhizobium cenepequi]
MSAADDDRVLQLALKRYHSEVRAGRAFGRRRAATNREWAARRDGSQGAAGPCRRVSVVDGTVLGEVHGCRATGLAIGRLEIGAPVLGVIVALDAAPLTTGAPVIGSPEAECLTQAAARQRLRRARKDAGAVVLQDQVIDDDMLDQMVALGWLADWDRHDPVKVAEVLMRELREALGL